MGLLNTLKYYGRGVVLPVEKIKETVRKNLSESNITEVLDFGSGTLFWSKWLADEMKLKVIAVDTMYENNQPENANQNITIETDIEKLFRQMHSNESNMGGRAIFVCDVIHHLQPSFWNALLLQISKLFDVVIIKDLDANRKLGNFCNKIHDRVINGEKVFNVFPDEIISHLSESGFKTQTESMPKLWYPHFVITGVRSNDL